MITAHLALLRTRRSYDTEQAGVKAHDMNAHGARRPYASASRPDQHNGKKKVAGG